MDNRDEMYWANVMGATLNMDASEPDNKLSQTFDERQLSPVGGVGPSGLDADTAGPASTDVLTSYKTHRKSGSHRFDSLGSIGSNLSFGSLGDIDLSNLQESTDGLDEQRQQKQQQQQHSNIARSQNHHRHHDSNSSIGAGPLEGIPERRRHKSNLSQVGRDLLVMDADVRGNQQQQQQQMLRVKDEKRQQRRQGHQRQHSVAHSQPDTLGDLAEHLAERSSRSRSPIAGVGVHKRTGSHFRMPPGLNTAANNNSTTTNSNGVDLMSLAPPSPHSSMSSAFMALQLDLGDSAAGVGDGLGELDDGVKHQEMNGSNFLKTQKFGLAQSFTLGSNFPAPPHTGHIRMHSGSQQPFYDDLPDSMINSALAMPATLGQVQATLQHAHEADECHESRKQRAKASKRNRPGSMSRVTRAPTCKRGAAAVRMSAPSGPGSRHVSQRSMPKVFERANELKSGPLVDMAAGPSLRNNGYGGQNLMGMPASPFDPSLAGPVNGLSQFVNPGPAPKPTGRFSNSFLSASRRGTARPASAGAVDSRHTDLSATFSHSQAVQPTAPRPSSGLAHGSSSGASGTSGTAKTSAKPVPQRNLSAGPTGPPRRKPVPENGRRRKAIPWTEEEDKRLLEMVKQHGPQNWRTIAEYVGSRTPAQVAQRWRKILNPDLLKVNKGKWTEEEDDRLRQMIAKHGQDWHKIAQGFSGTRTVKHCRERWLKHISPDLKRNEPWTVEEDTTLLKVRKQLGYNGWAEIAKSLPGRTDNAVKRRYRSLTNPRALSPQSGVDLSRALGVAQAGPH